MVQWVYLIEELSSCESIFFNSCSTNISAFYLSISLRLAVTHYTFLQFSLSVAVLLWIKSVKWKWGLSLAPPPPPPFLPPSLSRHQTKLCLNVFLRSWSAAKSCKWSSWEREGRREVGEEEGKRTKKKKYEPSGWKMNMGKRRSERQGQRTGHFQERLGFRAQHDLIFFCWATSPDSWLGISW